MNIKLIELAKLFRFDTADYTELKAGLVSRITMLDENTAQVKDKELIHWLTAFRNEGTVTMEEVLDTYNLSPESLVQLVKTKMLSSFRLSTQQGNKILFLKSELKNELDVHLVHSSRTDRLKLAGLAEKILIQFVDLHTVSKEHFDIFCQYYFSDKSIEQIAKKYSVSVTELEAIINKLQIIILGSFRASVSGIKKSREIAKENAVLKDKIEKQEKVFKSLTILKNSIDDLLNPKSPEQLAELKQEEIFHSTKLSEIDLSVRALNCLKAAEVDTLGQLLTFKKSDMLKFRNFGKKTLKEIENLMASYGIELK